MEEFKVKIKQINMDCYGCRGPLNNGEELVDVMQNAAVSSGAKVIGRNVQSYPVYGLTAVVFLAESHVLVSTYPEHNFSVVEVFMCNSDQDPYTCGNQILRYTKPTIIKTTEFSHDIGEKPKKPNNLLTRLSGTLESLISSIFDRREYCRDCGSFDYSKEFINARPNIPIGGFFARSMPHQPNWHYVCYNCQNEWYR